MENLKQLYNEKLQRVKKYCELSKEEQDTYENKLSELMCEMDDLLVDMDIDLPKMRYEILNGFEV